VHDVLTETMIEYHGITYTILEGSSQKRTRLLVSSLCYSYGIKVCQNVKIKKKNNVVNAYIYHKLNITISMGNFTLVNKDVSLFACSEINAVFTLN
jgi:hypothetical protein